MMRYFGDCSPDNWLFRPLDGLPGRAVLDANVLLDFLLIVDGIGSLVVSGLLKRGFTLFTTTVAIEEIKKTLGRGRENLCDLSPLADVLLKNTDIQVKPPMMAVPGVSKHDNHLAAVAQQYDAFVVSEDLPLLYDLNRERFHARSLREIALFLILPDHPRQELTVFGQGAGADGHIFLKVMPTKDVSSNIIRSWYLFDAEAFGSLRYDGSRKSLVFSASVGGELAIPVELIPETQYAILLNYSVGRSTQLSLKIRRFGDEAEISATTQVPPFAGRPVRAITVMNSRATDAGWSGSLQALTFGPYKLHRKVWRASHSLIGVAPPTLTSDLTFTAAILTEIKGDMIRRPLLQHVLELANMSIPGFYPGRRASERLAKWFD
ncbi:MAG: PIN domain-containing protein [Mesorhizobium sp.]|uniref:PIN domain-containing protein n=1 Tax=Mesorhizobium sp. TaxID=1871066 RepID=UPI00121EE522|nr:PIN domain-containing protein [Mesorhizobium sp.]TIL70345.1 MAG: PIN domain-containing protein [Mesorhizobium sp.]TIL87653.1 MAG: PIN domain-containing protein [Mesorhizobium sp.]TIL99115.1 MAG: PIN domain-containing protein [Mesorhizobium sp.]